MISFLKKKYFFGLPGSYDGIDFTSLYLILK